MRSSQEGNDLIFFEQAGTAASFIFYTVVSEGLKNNWVKYEMVCFKNPGLFLCFTG